MTNDELQALCESNARSIQAQGENIARLSSTVAAFIEHLGQEGLKVSLIQDVVDDVASESDSREQRIGANEERFEVLLDEARADRAENARRFDEQLAEIRAQGEQIRALLSALATTNGRVDSLENAS